MLAALLSHKTVDHLIAAARSKPGRVTFASQGIGTSAHLAGEMFSNLAKVELPTCRTAAPARPSPT